MIIKFTYKHNISPYSIKLAGENVPQVEKVKYLGLTLDTKLVWNAHIKDLIQRIRFRIRQLKSLMNKFSPISLTLKRLLYFSLIRPIWMYSCPIWGSASNSQINKILRLITVVLCMLICTYQQWNLCYRSAIHVSIGP